MEVIDLNRSRLVAGAIDALADGGYAAFTVAAVIERARVSRKTFYEVFANRHDCFEAVVAHIWARALAVVGASSTADMEWLAATRSGLGALLTLIDEDPALARIWFVESLAGHPAVLHQHARAMSTITDAVHLGGSDASESHRPSRIVAEATVGGISHIIHTRLVSASKEPFTALTGSFMYLITLPYLGQARAKAELRRAPAHVARSRPHVQRSRLDESLRETKIRLTYRTIRTLGAISDRPGASNLEVSIECGIQDQGQISKLLSRLVGLGLIENRGRGPALGLPNAWHITARGTELVGATRASIALGEPRGELGRRDAVGR
jgi:AcrR family transcriptional regulator